MKEKIYQIPNNLVSTQKIRKNIIIPIENELDRLSFEVIEEILNISLPKYSKYELIKELASLYDLEFNIFTKEYKNNIVLILQVESLKEEYLVDTQKMYSIINDFFKYFKVLDIDIVSELENLKNYYLNLVDNSFNKSKIEFLDHFYAPDKNHMNIDDIFLALEREERLIANIKKNFQRLETSFSFFLVQTDNYSSLKKNLQLSTNENLNINFNDFFKTTLDEKIEIRKVVSKEQVTYLKVYEGLIEDRIKLQLLNRILGGGASSKLFMNVRERYHLCYSISSKIINGTSILVAAEIDFENIEKARSKIDEQFDEIKHGNIKEFDLVKKKLLNDLIKREKDLGFNNDLIIESIIRGTDLISLKEIVNTLERTTEKEIIQLAKGFYSNKESIQN